MSDQKQARFIVGSEVRTVLEERRLKDKDLQKTIFTAEQTGQKFFHPETGHFLAGVKQDSVTVWVEYGPCDGGFEIYSAYQYRLDISAWDFRTGRTR